MLTGKKILLGITGSIAAYKSIQLVRMLSKAGADVKVVMTPAAKDFVSPLVLSTLSRNKVILALAESDEWANHVMLGRWADVFIIAPLSCNTLAKMANGLCDNMLLAVYLSATCPVAVAPAMDEDMWRHPTVARNLGLLTQAGNTIIPVENGELASGLYGEGRMAEPETIARFLTENFFRGTNLKGKQAFVTAGPTYEPIDPVRFIGNHSSGKMGFALAEELYLQGAEVTLITGPTKEIIAYEGIRTVHVQTAEEMYQASKSLAPDCDIIVMSAAVADYRPIEVSKEKIKKKAEEWELGLAKTKDILSYLGEHKAPHQFIAGFALETNNEKEHALGKLKQKNADCIILNSMNDKDAGFGVDTNKVTILHRSGEEKTIELKSKKAVAKDIVSFIIQHLNV